MLSETVFNRKKFQKSGQKMKLIINVYLKLVMKRIIPNRN